MRIVHAHGRRSRLYLQRPAPRAVERAAAVKAKAREANSGVGARANLEVRWEILLRDYERHSDVGATQAL